MSAPSQVNGQINSLVGTAETLVGGAIEQVYAAVGGSTAPSQFTTDGNERHAKGEAEVTAAKAKAVAEGAVDQVKGKVNSVVGAVTGDQAQQTKGNIQHQAGETKVDLNKN